MPIKRADQVIDSTRRQFLRQGFAGVGWVIAGGTLSRCSSSDGEMSSPAMSNIANLGPLLEPDENGLRLPAGFSSRVIARSGTAVEASSYVWHNAPDGGGVFTTGDGGWIYVSNSETLAAVGGGVGAVRFDRIGNIVDAYRILEGTDQNCAGGSTPWGTWLSCEETDTGLVWECDPLGESTGVARPAMGAFKHEAASVDAANRHVYLTEDVGDGRLYRFVYENAEDLSTGELQVAEVLGGGPEGAVEWRTVPDPSGVSEETRYQVSASTAFDGGEGIWLHEGVIYFATKGDNRVWAYETSTSMLTILYDAATSSTPILTGVDNLTVTPAGDVVVGEDGGDMQVVAISAEGSLVPLVQITGQDRSEVTGPAFGPSLQRLYFSSQRGTDGADLLGMSGITYEVSGPFFI
ncbi:MAG: PhoX family protein [Myxococcales bacterium]|nr:PhoX family protein [Myxococcales bacterium]